jgi:hypothetical protein
MTGDMFELVRFVLACPGVLLSRTGTTIFLLQVTRRTSTGAYGNVLQIGFTYRIKDGRHVYTSAIRS